MKATNQDQEYNELLNQPIGQLVKRTAKNIYKAQGFYSALVFFINAGMASSKDQETAERELMAVINEL